MLRILEVLRFTNCFLFEVILLSFQKIRLSTFFFNKIDSRTEHFLDLNLVLISTHFLSLISRLSSVKDLSFTDLRLICNFQSTFRSSSLKTQQYNIIRTASALRASSCERSRFASSHSRPFRRPLFQPSLVSFRKEVIQPHLPIRLPCYDLTPVICLTFDSSLLR